MLPRDSWSLSQHVDAIDGVTDGPQRDQNYRILSEFLPRKSLKLFMGRGTNLELKIFINVC